ncbi:MAG: excinuclease [Gammaproteobacteria bacterium]|nr:excinuclease [Gammaproteobacteria bacterium]
MKLKTILAVFLTALCLPVVSQARDTTHFLNFNEVLQEALAAGRLDGSVKFYLDSQPSGAKVIRKGLTTSKKTNAFNKSDQAACSWALQSALIQFETAAKNAGANAVVNLVSNYKHNVYKSRDNYECHAGGIMAGVALKGDLAKTR